MHAAALRAPLRKRLGRKSPSRPVLQMQPVFLGLGVLLFICLACYYYIFFRLIQRREIEVDGSLIRDITSGNATEPNTATSLNLLSAVHKALPTSQKAKATIAYLTSITACPVEDRLKFLDAGAVLKHSIHINSKRHPDSSSVYDYDMYAIIHTEASDCAKDFDKIGYTVLIKDTPFDLSEIRNPDYVKRLTNPNAGCCQEKEFLKLYAYTMHEYSVVVHLDMDFLVLKPMDHLFDAFFQPDEETKNIPDAMWPEDRRWTGRIETMFTRDYPMGKPWWDSFKNGMQGGFWILRPNQTAFDELLEIIRQGQFSRGWYDDKEHFPGFYGAAMIQGLVAWYYGHYHPNQALELQRCMHNQMVDHPKDNDGTCFVTVGDDCRDCRAENVTDIFSAHFTFCGKPWKCIDKSYFGAKSKGRARLCLELHERWHSTRHDLEKLLGVAKPFTEGDRYYGHCDHWHHRYVPINFSA